MAIPAKKNTLYIQRGLTRKRSIIMGIDSTKLEVLQKVVATVDGDFGNKNGKIDTEAESSIFKGELAKLVAKEELTQDDADKMSSLLGLEKTEQNKEESKTTNPMSRKEKKAAKKEAESKENLVVRYLNTIVNEGQDIEAGLAEKLGTLKDTPEYKELQEKVLSIEAAIDKIGYNSREDVEKLEKAVKEELGIGKKDDFEKDVLELLVKSAEQKQKAKEYKEIKDAFLAEYNKGGKNLEETYNVIKEQFKDRGSYINHKRGGLLKDFREDYVKGELGTQLAMDVINNTEGTGFKEVRRNANDTIKEKYNDDKYVPTIKKEGAKIAFGGEESRLHIAAANRVRANKVEEAKEQTKEEILKALGGKTEIFEALVATGLIEEKDGKYDLSVLSAIIGNEVGADNYLDKMSKKYQAIGEKLGTYTELEVQTKLDDLSDKEAKQLIKLCGYEIEGKNWGKVLLKTVVGGLFGALTAGGAEAARQNHTYRYNNSNSISNSIHIDTDDLDNMKITTIIDGVEVPSEVPPVSITLPEGATNAARVIVDVTTNVDVIKDIAFKGGKFILTNAMSGAVIGAALGFLNGVLSDDASEIPIAEINFDDMSYADYIKRVEKKFPEWSDALTMIALTFHDKDGNWDCKGYRDFLRKAAGNDVLNKKELVAALQNKPEKEEPKQEPPTQEEHCEEPQKCLLEQDSKHVDTTLTHKIKYGDSWEELVKAYFPTWKDCFGKMYGKGGAIQALKSAIANGDQKLYSKLLAGYIPSEINIPQNLGDCLRNDDGKVQFRTPVGTPKGYMGKVGVKTGYNEVTLTDCNGNTAKGANVDEALTNFNKKHETEYTKEDILKKEDI